MIIFKIIEVNKLHRHCGKLKHMLEISQECFWKNTTSQLQGSNQLYYYLVNGIAIYR